MRFAPPGLKTKSNIKFAFEGEEEAELRQPRKDSRGQQGSCSRATCGSSATARSIRPAVS